MRSFGHCRRCGVGLKGRHYEQCPLRWENADGKARVERKRTALGITWADWNVVTGDDCGPARPNDKRDAHMPAPDFGRAA